MKVFREVLFIVDILLICLVVYLLIDKFYLTKEVSPETEVSYELSVELSYPRAVEYSMYESDEYYKYIATSTVLYVIDKQLSPTYSKSIIESEWGTVDILYTSEYNAVRLYYNYGTQELYLFSKDTDWLSSFTMTLLRKDLDLDDGKEDN